jgi:4-amino-4-deoxy-L-arabinose transferase-like glycosyltransferase
MPRLSPGATRWLLILLLALVLRACAGAWWQSRLAEGQTFFFGDSDSYWVLGRAIAHGGPYEYHTSDARVFRTPGYPLLLSGLFAVAGDAPPIMAARLLNALLGTAAVGVVGWWTSRLFDRRAGEIAGILAAVYPGAVAMSAFVLSEAPFCLVMLLQLAWWGAACRAATTRAAVILASCCGAAGAAATLIRPSWLLFTPLAALLIALIGPRRQQQWLHGGVLLAAFALCMAPWWIRNAQVTGHFVATTLQVGASLYDGLNPDALGSSDMSFVPRFEAEERAAGRPAGESDSFEYRLDRRMARAAMSWAAENPRRVVELAAIKLARIWNVWPNEPTLRRWPIAIVVMASYLPLSCLSIAGAWRYRSAGWPYVLPWLPAIYFTLLHVVFVGSIRYREPAMLAVMPLAAAVLSGMTGNRNVGNFSRQTSPSPKPRGRQDF